MTYVKCRTVWHVVQQQLVGMASLQKSLPNMMMCINKPRGDNLVFTVKNLGVWGRTDFSFNLRDDIAFDQEICFDGMYVIILIMNQDSPALKKYWICWHDDDSTVD